ncbi:ATP-binding protein [Nocardioides sp.]|uniref:sensor histidine kinase n=1 Tax=Nocardioides sp. TaxID=35761 RepID=UPI001A1A2B54|nr:ATP-binding protein [Nocardioides sp.]MBJ7358779.1 HAMP domain-containing protein [Nocardioides sp.]
MRRGLSVRWRLTLVYSLISVLSAAALLGVVYTLVSHPPKTMFVMGETRLPDGGVPADAPRAELASPDLRARADGEEGLYRVLVNARTDAVDDTLDRLLWWSGAGLLLTAAVSVGVGWLFAGRVLAPVHTITSRARAISADSLDERVSLGGPHDELRELADTFDSLLDRIHEAFAGERRLVATMSHELRTPLANQQVALDVALSDPDAGATELREAAEVALDQNRRAARTIDALLTLARVQSGAQPAQHAPVELDLVVSEVAAAARTDDLAWHVELVPVTVLGDAQLLERAVTNLVQNAVEHNVPGGRVDVRLTADRAAARLVVESSGPLISPEVAAGLTLPFRRGVTDRTSSDRGVGLGLSIVQAVADHHGGRLTLTPLESGGLSVELELPVGGESAGTVGRGN